MDQPHPFEPDEQISDLLLRLQEKHESVGEDLKDHLEGMLYGYFLNYWDYVGVDALLNLQKPRTKYPDEMVFIIYHQITELHFKLIMHEMEQIGFHEKLTAEFFTEKLSRINIYWKHLISTFEILAHGMAHEQFLAFRKALVPASGFQSVQYRLIELWSTPFRNLVAHDKRADFQEDSPIEEMSPFLYWRQGATDPKGNKTLTLAQFEDKYSKLINRKGNEFRQRNLWSRYKSLSPTEQLDEALIEQMRGLDVNANINWNLMHLRYAEKYLTRGKAAVRGTGGTNWKEYLPPRFQRQVFYPALWTESELNDWGRSWVENVMLA